MNSSHASLQIRLPEGVVFSIPLTSPVSRCFAFLIDFCVISALTTAFELLINIFRPLREDLAAGLLIILYLATWMLYGVLCEYLWFGQTMGKFLLRIRVMDASGLRLQLHQIVLRNLIRTVDLFPALGLLGGLVMLCNRRVQRLGDLAAGTVVIRQRRSMTETFADSLSRARYNSFAQHHLLCARLRQKVSPAAASVAFEAIRRCHLLNDHARLALFDNLAAFFASIVPFPAEDVEQLSSEQYVRNVVEILYSTSAIQREPRQAGHVHV